jgi:hypothetical protein
MNRIVKEHYPVEKLPEDLREGFEPDALVTLTIEPDAQTAVTGEQAFQRLLSDMATWRLDGSGDDSVMRVRELRDEWDD